MYEREHLLAGRLIKQKPGLLNGIKYMLPGYINAIIIPALYLVFRMLKFLYVRINHLDRVE
jgi:hypothetical protein